MNKEFLDVDTIRNNGLLIAEKMYADNFIPSVIYVSLRGGATLGNIISEYFKLVAPVDTPPLYAAVVAHSYIGLHSNQKIFIDGWTYEPKFLRKQDKVLLIDDIFDSGLTINFIAQALLSHNILPESLKIAVHDYKVRTYTPHSHAYTPHYYCRKLVIDTPQNDNWIHYLSHEIEGLDLEEITQHYPPTLVTTISRALEIRKKNLNVKT